MINLDPERHRGDTECGAVGVALGAIEPLKPLQEIVQYIEMCPLGPCKDVQGLFFTSEGDMSYDFFLTASVARHHRL